ncbi:MAG TPA: hypothetical protein VGI40_03020 [Pirellulaceae bacterium]|jgi:hypothetical protein
MIVHRAALSTQETPIDRVLARLTGLRRGIAVRTLVAGLAKTLWLVLALAAVDLALDWLLHLEVAQRAGMLAIALTSVVWCVYRFLWTPLAAHVSDDALALAIEAAHPRLGQALITALQLSRREEPMKGASNGLRQLAISSGSKLADEVSFDSILDSQRSARNAGFLALAAMCIVGCVAAFPFSPILRIWLSRNLLLSPATWPQQTYLTIGRLTDSGTVVFPRGVVWTQAVEVSEDSAVVPDAVYLDIREAARGQRRTSVVMERYSDRRFESVFRDCLQPFEFRARGGDAVTDWVRVQLVDPPELSELTITVAPPPYSGQPPEALVPGQNAYQVLRGSSLQIAALANKPLQTAELILDERRWPLHINNRDRRSRLASQIPATELAEGVYSIELVDALGLSARATNFNLRWLADREPRVTARLSGIGNLVLPQAKLPVHCQASDDYGLTSLVASLTAGSSDVEPEKRVLPFIRPGELGEIGKPTDHRDVTVSESIDLEPFKLPVGANLRLQVEASDNNDITGPSVGHSAEFFLRVVDEAEFRSDLLRREKAERHELERLWKAQDDLVTESRALAAATTVSDLPNSSQLEQLQSIYRGQKQIGNKLAGLADRIAALAAEIENNRLPDPGGALQNRLTKKIASPLRTLSSQDVPPLVQLLDRLRQSLPSGGQLDLTQVTAGQVAIADSIKRVLEQMLSSEGYQEAIDLLYEIHKAQSGVYEQTNKAREEQVKRILEGRE